MHFFEGSFEMAKLVEDASANGLIENISYSPEKIFEWSEKYKKEKKSLLERELLEVQELIFFSVVESPLRKDLILPDIVPLFWDNSFYPLFSLGVNRFGVVESQRLFLPIDRFARELLKELSFTIGLFSSFTKQSIFRKINLSVLPSDYWTSAEVWADSHARVTSGKISKPEHSIKQWETAKIYADVNCEPKKYPNVYYDYFYRYERELSLLLLGYFFRGAETLGNEIKYASGLSAKTRYNLESPSALYGQISGLIAQKNKELISDFFEYTEEMRSKGLNEIETWLWNFFRVCLWNPVLTENGTRLPTLNEDEYRTLSSYPLNLEALVGKEEEFWNTISLDLPFFFKETIGDSNIQASLEEMLANFPPFTGNVIEAQQSISDQLREACSLKQYTLPFGAFFQLSGSICGIKVFEVDKSVYLLFILKNGRFCRFTISPETQIFAVAPPTFHRGFSDGGITYTSNAISGIQSPLLLGVCMLAASIIRDGWVVEEREKVFGGGILTRKVSPLLGDRRKQVVVYLPRIKYLTSGESIPDARTELNYVKRREHLVSGHLRNAVKASPAQVLLAQKMGVYVPEGKTFVRGHSRGHLAAEKIYRSRSALMCLRMIDKEASGQDAWFGFERNAKQWLEGHGFKVDHASASRNGDGGVDLQASKGSENLLIQCKYWKNPVGLNVVREMIGTLITFPAGSQGVILTSSELTIPAKELAIEHHIQFVENVSFEKPIDHKLKKGAKGK